MSAKFCQLWLTCKDKAEVDRITTVLLDKHLVACVRQIPISSNYHWKGKIEKSREILLMMESQIDNFEKVEAAVAKLHSYDTFVLEAVPVSKISKKAAAWLKQELRNG